MSSELVPAGLQPTLAKYKIDVSTANSLLEEYGAPFTEAGEILATYSDIVVADEADKDTMKLARTRRLALRAVRISVENKRKELKEDIVKRGNAIDGVARFVKDVITPAEEYLQGQEDYGAIKAAERLVALKAERIERLAPYVSDLSIYNLEAMTAEAFDELEAKVKADHEAKLQAEAAAKAAAEQAEREREAERLRIIEENQKLKEEQEQARQAAAEAAKQLEAERKIQEEKLAAERKAAEDQEIKLRAERERAEAELEAARRAERERVAAEEAKLREEREQQRQAELAPDREKLISFASTLETMRQSQLPTVSSKEAQAVVDLIGASFEKLEGMIVDKAKRL